MRQHVVSAAGLPISRRQSAVLAGGPRRAGPPGPPGGRGTIRYARGASGQGGMRRSARRRGAYGRVIAYMMLLANSGSFISERNVVYSATKNCAEELL